MLRAPRVCERHEGEPDDGLHDLMDFVHTQSRQKGHQLGFDQPGHVERGMGAGTRGGTDLSPRSDPRHKEHEHFAREIAQYLDKAVSSRRCERIVLIASDPFLGEVKAQLGPATARAVWACDADRRHGTERARVGAAGRCPDGGLKTGALYLSSPQAEGRSPLVEVVLPRHSAPARPCWAGLACPGCGSCGC